MASPETIKRGIAAFTQGQQFYAQKKLPEAAAAYQHAVALLPEHPQLLLAYADLAEEVADYASAEKLYRRLGNVRPESGFEGRLATVLFRLQKYVDAIPYYEAYLDRLAAKGSSDGDMLHALSSCLSMAGRWEEALERARQALAIEETARYRDAELNALYNLGRAEELDACIDDMLARYPESREIRSLFALQKLKSGDFRNGFRFFEDLRWRNNLKNRNPNSPDGTIKSDWDGQPFDGVLIITTEQGLGDEIMLSSMFEELFATGQRAIIECDERLRPLYQRSFPGQEFVARQKKNSITVPAGTDVRHLAALDLARALQRDSDSFPARKHWLKADPQRVANLRKAYRKNWPGKRLVGLSWKSARVMDGGGATKNIDITDFVPMLAERDSRFINLQYGNISGDLAALRGAGVSLFVDDDIDTMNDIDGLAAQIAALDLVISTSNTTVHIAGALGVPCWLLLPKHRPILWYWGYRGDTTPWYPSLRLIRNPEEKTWDALLASVTEDLAGLTIPES